jgi:hypothetical protein
MKCEEFFVLGYNAVESLDFNELLDFISQKIKLFIPLL